MEEMIPERIGQDIGMLCKDMYLRVKEDGDPVTAHLNDVRIIMFKEEKFIDPQYDGPRQEEEKTMTGQRTVDNNGCLYNWWDNSRICNMGKIETNAPIY